MTTNPNAIFEISKRTDYASSDLYNDGILVEQSVAGGKAFLAMGGNRDKVAHLDEAETRSLIAALAKTIGEEFPAPAPAPRAYKAGDRVRVLAATGGGCSSVGCCAPEVGKVYTVKRDGVDADGDLRLKASDDSFRVVYTKPADVEPVTEPEPEPIKVGDVVRITANILPSGGPGGLGDSIIGKIGVVTQVGRTTYDDKPFVKGPGGYRLTPECFERVETLTERPAIGETVMVTTTPSAGYGYEAGDLVTVTVVAGPFMGGRSHRTGEHVGGMSWDKVVHVAAPKDAGNGFVVGESVTVSSGADGYVAERPEGVKARGVVFVEMRHTGDVVAFPASTVTSTARRYA